MISISISQFNPKHSDLEANFMKIISDISVSLSDIIIFPELCLSGYYFDDAKELEKVALKLSDLRLLELNNIAATKNIIVILGFAEKTEEGIYNSCAILGDGEPIIYRKTHLFYKERLCFLEGNTGFVNHYIPRLDINIGLMICYDWRFPESARMLAINGADLIVCPSNLVTGIWRKVMPARAIENKVYVAVANRIGEENFGDEKLIFNGFSAIYDYIGNEIAVAEENNTDIITAEINPKATRDKSFNAINDIIKDRRTSYYN